MTTQHLEQIRRKAWHHASYIDAVRSLGKPQLVTWHATWVHALAFATGEDWRT